LNWLLHEETLVSYTYFVLASPSGLVKIGQANDPVKRLTLLQVGSPEILELLLALPHKPPFEEHQMHWRFRTYRRHGEWFDYLGDVKRFVEEKLVNPNPTKEDDSVLAPVKGRGSEAERGYVYPLERPNRTRPLRSLGYGLPPATDERDASHHGPSWRDYNPRKDMGATYAREPIINRLRRICHL
jgi:hypothetical protein